MQQRQAAGFLAKEMWRLRKQLPGRRTAGKRLIDHAAGILVVDLEMARCAECPCFFKSKSGVVIELHMDDFHGTGPAEACAEVIEQLRVKLKLKVSPMLEPMVHYQHLKRHRVRGTEGTFIAGSNQHARNVLEALGFDDCNPVSTPSSNSTLPSSTDELDQEAAYLYRSCAGSLLYLSHDRSDIMWEIGLLSSQMSSPT